ncbi:hypothetical protein [Sphingomonas glacialis]|uniref:Uncharacterized protein n=1 Tax=Sphingomonas glacialis TaxID=658225 RepID=A0A502FAG8_9SPHN|nr:hypothetical protein [Sphingomonas glacialis]TPG46396.1 hypothetical protein EAH76_23580 [Sphingomonas glacialis]
MEDLQPNRNAVGAANLVPLARFLAGEIAVGTVINIAFNLFFAWLVFHGRTPVGRDAVLLDMIPAAFIPALLMTFPVTVLIRKRVNQGLAVTPIASLPFVLPRRLLWRAASIALLALALVALPAIVLLWSCWGSDWSWKVLVVFKIAFSAFHAAMITPIVVLAALRLDGA